LYFNGSRKYIGTFDEQKKETKTEILTVDDIFKFEEILHKTVDWFDSEKVQAN
jgi:hypothetical protein